MSIKIEDITTENVLDYKLCIRCKKIININTERFCEGWFSISEGENIIEELCECRSCFDKEIKIKDMIRKNTRLSNIKKYAEESEEMKEKLSKMRTC